MSRSPDEIDFDVDLEFAQALPNQDGSMLQEGSKNTAPERWADSEKKNNDMRNNFAKDF